MKREKGRAASIFKLKENIVGAKRSPLEPFAVIDPQTGFEVMEPEAIKGVCLKYVVNMLTNRPPKAEFIELVNAKVRLHWMRMNEVIPNDIDELSLKMFNDTLRSLSRKKPDKYLFILKGGQDLINAIFMTFAHIWRSEEFHK